MWSARRVANAMIVIDGFTESVRGTSAPSPTNRRFTSCDSAFSFTTALVVVTFAVASLTWLASRPRFVLTIPDGTVDFLDRLTTMAATAAVAAFSIGVVAMLAWTVRAGSRALRSAVSRLGD